jgi:hypothetical protein
MIRYRTRKTGDLFSFSDISYIDLGWQNISDKFVLSNCCDNYITYIMCQSELFSHSNLDAMRAGIHVNIFSKIILQNFVELLEMRISNKKFASKNLHLHTFYSLKAACQANSNETDDHINIKCWRSAWMTIWSILSLSYVET